MKDVAGFVFRVVLPLKFNRIPRNENHLESGWPVGQFTGAGLSVVGVPIVRMRLGAWARLIELLPGEPIPLGGKLLELRDDVLVAAIVRIGDSTGWERVIREVFFDQGMERVDF